MPVTTTTYRIAAHGELNEQKQTATGWEDAHEGNRNFDVADHEDMFPDKPLDPEDGYEDDSHDEMQNAASLTSPNETAVDFAPLFEQWDNPPA